MYFTKTKTVIISHDPTQLNSTRQKSPVFCQSSVSETAPTATCMIGHPVSSNLQVPELSLLSRPSLDQERRTGKDTEGKEKETEEEGTASKEWETRELIFLGSCDLWYSYVHACSCVFRIAGRRLSSISYNTVVLCTQTLDALIALLSLATNRSVFKYNTKYRR